MTTQTTKTILDEIIEKERTNFASSLEVRAGMEIVRLRSALTEIAAEELDEGDDPEDEPTFGARHYIEIARKALKNV